MPPQSAEMVNPQRIADEIIWETKAPKTSLQATRLNILGVLPRQILDG